MLEFTLRVRDLLHGTIFFTEEEKEIIDHPLFQRLRQVRQNDVAFTAYPSMNTSRFEHVLGVCHIAGAMAEHIGEDPRWSHYARSLRDVTGLSPRYARRDFVRLARLYALFHDIGHLPLSHLFEMALDRYALTNGLDGYHIAHRWGGHPNRKSAHESYGATIAEIVLEEVELEDSLKRILLRLLREEKIADEDPLNIVKKLVSSEMDADRIDAYKRDGLLAGGEYGSYDVKRLAVSPFLVQGAEGWSLAYSEKALSSLEALLLDRNRVLQWVHFHHRVVTNKVLTIMLIEYALTNGAIGDEHFSLSRHQELAYRDDVWLWNVLRALPVPDDSALACAKQALLLREKNNVLSLWKRRTDFHRLEQSALDVAMRMVVTKPPDAQLERAVKRKLGLDARYFKVPPHKKEGTEIRLYSERKGVGTQKTLAQVSKLVEDLHLIWADEPTFYMVFVGKDVGKNPDKHRAQWISAYAEWLKE